MDNKKTWDICGMILGIVVIIVGIVFCANPFYTTESYYREYGADYYTDSYNAENKIITNTASTVEGVAASAGAIMIVGGVLMFICFGKKAMCEDEEVYTFSTTTRAMIDATNELKEIKELLEEMKNIPIVSISPANISQASADAVIKTSVEEDTSSSTSANEDSNQEVYVDPEKRSLEEKQADLNSEIAKQDQIILRARKDKRAEVPSHIESQKLWNQINDLEQRRDTLGVFDGSDKKKIDYEISTLDSKRSALNDKAEEEQKKRNAEADKKIASAEATKANLQKELNEVIKRIYEIDKAHEEEQEE